jgi:hypothetical protein
MVYVGISEGTANKPKDSQDKNTTSPVGRLDHTFVNSAQQS